jgi:hypothetical protein
MKVEIDISKASEEYVKSLWLKYFKENKEIIMAELAKL